MAVEIKKDHDVLTLLASTTSAVNGNGDSVRLAGMVNAMAFTLDLTAAATAVGDLLDVYVQTMIDGTNWLDVARFTRCLGNGGALRYTTKLTADLVLAEFETGTGLAAAAIRDLLGDQWRIRWAITDTGAASFTFSVVACPM